MYSQANLEIAIIISVVVFTWLMTRLVKWVKTKKINTELWCTVFEGMTMGAIRLDHLKNPETVIEKKIRKDGKDKDDPSTLDPEYQEEET